MRHHRFLWPAISVVALVTLLLPQAALAAVPALVNGSFETGDLTGWDVVVPDGGFAAAVTDDAGFDDDGIEGTGYGPPEGAYFALLKTNGPGSMTTLSQTLTAAAGDTISFCAFFNGEDYMPFDDAGSVEILNAAGVFVGTPFGTSVSHLGDYMGTPWTYGEHTFEADGTYTLKAMIFNGGDESLDSYMGLDAVGTATPELCASAPFPPPPALSGITGHKWNDLSGDGVQDPGEPGVPGVEICAFPQGDGEGGGEFAANAVGGPPDGQAFCATTDADGDYAITDLPPGAYVVFELLPPGTSQTYPPEGIPHLIGLEPGQVQGGVDFGNTVGGAVTGFKWDDLNGDGVHDPNEPGLADVEICAYRLTPPDNEGVRAGCVLTQADDPSTEEDETGTYSLSVAVGFYRIAETAPAGMTQTFPAGGVPYFIDIAQGATATGVDFGNQGVPPGRITGTKWQDTDGDGIHDPGEPGVAGVTVCIFPLWQCVQTDASGNYAFDVAAGTYTVWEDLPSGSTNTTPLQRTVTVASGETVDGVDFGNRTPTPPPPEVTVNGASSWTYSGLPVVYWGNPTTYTKDVTAHCGPNEPVQVRLVISFSESGTVFSQMMTKTGPGEVWSATFPPFFPAHGPATLTFWVDCPPDTANFPEDLTDANGDGIPDTMSSEDEIQHGGTIYVDPAGTIRDSCTGSPIEGATVTLFVESPPGSGTFVEVDASAGFIPAVNPQTTGADGKYGWTLAPAGTYKVRVAHAGHVTTDSAAVTVPPAVTDLDVTLARDGGCPPENINGSLVVTSRATAFSPAPAPGAPAGVYTITATFQNTSADTISGLYFEVMALGPGDKKVLNCDGGPGGVGCRVLVDAAALGGDGVLSPGETFTAVFQIGLDVRQQFTFFVDAWGVTS